MNQIQETLRLEFNKPIVIGKGENALPPVAHVELREPYAHELEKAQRADTPAGGVIILVHLVGNVPLAVAQKMSQRDVWRANNFFNGFNGGPEEAEAGLS